MLLCDVTLPPIQCADFQQFISQAASRLQRFGPEQALLRHKGVNWICSAEARQCPTQLGFDHLWLKHIHRELLMPELSKTIPDKARVQVGVQSQFPACPWRRNTGAFQRDKLSAK